MPIEVSIINSPESVVISQKSHVFPDEGGSLGRGSNNFWILEDPNKYMSSAHASITVVGNDFFLVDTSTNGTFINGNAEPIGKGNQVQLNQGDTFSISDYEFVVTLPNSSASLDPFALPISEPSAPSTDPFGADPFSNNDNLFGDLPESPQGANNNDPFASSPVGLGPNDDQLNTDPLKMLPDTNAPFKETIPDDFLGFGGTPVDNSPDKDSIVWPTVKTEPATAPQMIPDDWDNLDLSPNSPPVEPAAPTAHVPSNPIGDHQAPIVAAPLTNPVSEPIIPETAAIQSNEAYKALEQKNSELSAEIEQLKAQLAAEKTKASANNNQVVTGDGQQVLITAMGLDKWNLPPEKVAEIHQIAGKMMRETMEGMMQVLKFRKKIKEEFRINVTTIQSVENNPLKFSANVDDAMENMFIKENNAYKAPLDAVKEGFQGIAEHQVAVIAGMQAAFRGMIDRFEPNNLENRFEKYKSSSFLSLGQKTKRWNAYIEYHQGLVENLDDSFQHLFGYDFVQAYEEQMHSLVSARFSSNSTDSITE